MTVYYDDSVVHNVNSIAFIEDLVKLFDSIGNLLVTITRNQLVSINNN